MNPFESHAPGLVGPGSDAFLVTPSNTADLPRIARALQVWGSGTLSFVTVDGTTLSISHPGGGVPLLVGVRRVRSTGTTATQIMAIP